MKDYFSQKIAETSMIYKLIKKDIYFVNKSNLRLVFNINTKMLLNLDKNTFRNIVSKITNHQFHLVDSSQIPILTALSAMLLVLSIVFRWHPSTNNLVVFWDSWILTHLACLLFTVTLLSWFISVVRESNAGYHTEVVQRGLKLGMILFIVSEILFFFAFFWAFFHFSLAPSIFIGCVWPPKGTQPIDPWGLPLVNTLLLLSSGVTITLAHHALLHSMALSSRTSFLRYLFSTIVLGITFLLCQAIEYKYGITFSWKDNIYGSIFFVTTGFHGFHVTVGTLFLLFCLTRESFDKFLITKPYGVFFSIIYHNYYTEVIQSSADSRLQALKKIELNLYWPGLLRNEGDQTYNLPIIVPAKLVKVFILWQSPQDSDNWSWMFAQPESKAWFDYYQNNRQLVYSIINQNIQKDLSTPTQHLGFEAAAWYWHFVDVVWLFLFVTIYWWGS